MKPKVSIVVPMYGVEKYLKTCIDSLINQSLQNLEIILVDDGSPDNCGEIADQYAEMDERIQVIHKKNGGLSSARNAGMLMATGDYIGFVDSDDWVNKNMFSHLYSAALKSDADIAVGGHCDFRNGKVKKIKKHPLAGKTVRERKEIDEIRKNLCGRNIADHETEAFPMSVWIAIYRRSLIFQNDLHFENTISEDVIFNLSAYKYANAIAFIGDTDYCYRTENQGSIVRSFSKKKLKQYENYLLLLAETVSKENDAEYLTRVKRASINCCRLYARQVSSASLSLKEKIKYLDMYAKSKIIQNYWVDYPIDSLPVFQRIFQKSMLHGHYFIALLLMDIRQFLK